MLAGTYALKTLVDIGLAPRSALDHLGYRPADPKIAIFSANPGSSVEVRDAADVAFATMFGSMRSHAPVIRIGARDDPAGGFTLPGHSTEALSTSEEAEASPLRSAGGGD